MSNPSITLLLQPHTVKDIMVTAGTKDDKEKIRCLHRHIKPDSSASSLLTATAFTDPGNLTDNKKNCEGLIDGFGGRQFGGPLVWIN